MEGHSQVAFTKSLITWARAVATWQG